MPLGSVQTVLEDARSIDGLGVITFRDRTTRHDELWTDLELEVLLARSSGNGQRNIVGCQMCNKPADKAVKGTALQQVRQMRRT